MRKIREIDIQNKIRLALSDHAIIFRANVGKVRMKDGRFFDTGLPRGYSDLSGVRKSDGKAIFIEVKNDKGKTSKYQDNFIKQMIKAGAIAGVARSPREALKLIGVETNE